MKLLLSGLLGLTALASAAHAQLDGTLLRSHTSPGGWMAGPVGLGNHGTALFTATRGTQRGTLLVPADAQAPILELPQVVDTVEVQVESAARADLHLSLSEELVPGAYPDCRTVLRAHSSGSASPLWSASSTFTNLVGSSKGCAVADDGSTAAFWSKGSNALKTELVILDAQTGSLRWNLELPASATSGALSGDGSSLFLSASPYLYEVDTLSGSVTSLGWVLSADRRGLHASADGSRLVLGENSAIRVLDRQPDGSFAPASYGSIPWEDYHNALAVSANGKVVAVGTSSGAEGKPVTIRCIDLDSGAELIRHSLVSAQNLASLVMGLSVSDSGERIAAALTGDATQVGPEVLLFTCWQDEPIWSLDLQSSAYDVELSPDGQRLGLSLLEGSLTGGGATRGSYAIFEVEPTPLVLVGQASAGSTVRLVQRLEGSTHGCLLVSPALADTPTTFGRIGTLFLDRLQTTVIHGGTLTPEGHLSTPVQLGGLQAGLTLHFQGLQLGPRLLTETRVSVTVAP